MIEDFMTGFFANLIGMSIQASAVIVVVLLLRVLFQKINISKKYVMVLWLIPFVCLVLPWRITSPVGVWEKAPAEYDYGKVIGNEIGGIAGDNLNADGIVNMNGDVAGDSNVVGSDSVNSNANDVGSSGNSNGVNANAGSSIDSDSTGLSDKTVNDSMASSVKDESRAEIAANCLAVLWGIGVVGLGIYSALSFWKLKQQLRKNIPVRERVYFVDELPVPMVVGLVKSKIYIPSGVEKEHIDYVIAHEETHIRRKDTWTKLAAYAITCIHWFNPLVWLAYNLMIKDMEMSCDEETILHLGENRKKEYATALLQLSTGKRNVFAVPVAFGEGSTKGRIMNILKYKKTKTVLAVAALVIGVLLAVLFLTKGEGDSENNLPDTEDVQDTSDTENVEKNEDDNSQEVDDAYQKIFTLPEEEIVEAWLEYVYTKSGNWSGFFGNYSGADFQRIEFEGNYCGPSTRSDIVYYAAGANEDIQTVAKNMIDYMISPLTEEKDGRPYTITRYELSEPLLTEVRENAWILDSVSGYYEYEGIDIIPMEEALKYETVKDGMVPFISQGSKITTQYVLIKDGNVYRLQRFSDMLNLYNGQEERKTTTYTGVKETKSDAVSIFDGTLEKDTDMFRVWLDSAVHMQKNSGLLEGFSMAEYTENYQVYPALYDDEIVLIFRDKTADLIVLNRMESYSIELKNQLYSFDSIIDGRAVGKWYDVNLDGAKDFVITKWESGTGINIQKLCVIDIHNKKVIPKDVSMEELAENLYDRGTVSAEVVIDTDSDWYDISDDGVIYTEMALLSDSEPIPGDYLGKVICDLKYDLATDSFVLDTDTIRVEWYD